MWIVADWNRQFLARGFGIPSVLPPTRYPACSASGVGAFNYRCGEPEVLAQVPAGSGPVELELRGDVGVSTLVVRTGSHVTLDGVALMELVPDVTCCASMTDRVVAFAEWTGVGLDRSLGPTMALRVVGDRRFRSEPVDGRALPDE